MNLAGHIAVASTLTPNQPRFWLGNALPDIAAMGRFRLLGDTALSDVAAGISLHHRADDAFHRHPWFTSKLTLLKTALTAEGLPRGAVRAIAHVGPELLLDGQLLTTDPDSTPLAVAQLIDIGSELETLVAAEHRPRWRTHLDRVVEHGVPRDYHDPDAVALRLHRILEHRPRLGFDVDAVPTVANHLRSLKPEIDETAADLITALSNELSDSIQ